jgi:tRNA A-37 threonylcarbamoyl transferase component Bud32/tetratricopeptide (TPR) repeat protein
MSDETPARTATLMATIISRRYEVIGQLGRGGMGLVYKVRHTALETILALKVLPAYLMENQDIVTRFSREARVMARLNHPNIVRVIDIERDESLNLYYFVMEYIEGETLGQYVRKKGSLPLPEVVEIGKQVASALGYAHNHNPPIVHRDIKPANIMIEARSNRVVVMDFGIAKELGDAGSTNTQGVIGTVKYASPEQLRHEPLEGSADVYSLGMVLYEMYTGKQFFAGLDENIVLSKVLYDPQENEPRFDRPAPAPFVELVTRAVAKTRSRRYQHMEDLLHALEACRAQQRREEPNAVSLRNAERVRQEVAAAKAEAEHYGARERARSFYGRGLSVEAQAEDLWERQSYTQAAQAYGEAIQCFADARDLAYRETLREGIEVARAEAATARQQSDDAWKQAEGAGARTRFAAAFAAARRLAERGLEKEMLEEFPQALDCYRRARQQFLQLVQEVERQVERERAEEGKQRVTDSNTVVAAPAPGRGPQRRPGVQRQETEGEEMWQAGESAWARERYEQAGQIHDLARVEAESSPGTVITPPRQTTGQLVRGKWAAILLGTVVMSATVMWFVALRKESPSNLPPPQVQVPPPPATTPVSSTPKPAPAESPPPLPPPFPGERQSPPVVARPDVTESLRLGQFFQDRGQYDEAIRELEEARGRDPDNADVVTALKRVRSAKEAEDKIKRSP